MIQIVVPSLKSARQDIRPLSYFLNAAKTLIFLMFAICLKPHMVKSQTCGAGMCAYHGVCHACTGGTYSPVTGVECQGKSATTGYGICIWCPAGSYQTSPGATYCSICPAGTYRPLESDRLECLSCPRGTFGPNPGLTSLNDCLNCTAGSFSPIDASSVCELCPAGKYQPHEKSIDCLSCKRGSYGSYAGMNSAACKYCPAGTYSYGNNSDESFVRGNNDQPMMLSTISSKRFLQSTTGLASTSCRVCPVGRYSPDGSSYDKNPSGVSNTGRLSYNILSSSGTDCPWYNFSVTNDTLSIIELTLAFFYFAAHVVIVIYKSKKSTSNIYDRLTIALGFLIYTVIPVLDTLTDLAYLLTVSFANLAVVVVACLCYLLPKFYFMRYLLWGTGSTNKQALVENHPRVFIRPRFPFWDMPSSLLFSKYDVLYKYIVTLIVSFPYLIINCPFLLMWLLLGVFLFNIKVMAIVPIQKLWFYIWTHPSMEKQHYHRMLLNSKKGVVDGKVLNESIYITALIETFPWIAIQVINNIATVGMSNWSPLAILSLVFSVSNAFLVFCRVCFYRCYKKRSRLIDAPIELSIAGISILDVQQEAIAPLSMSSTTNNESIDSAGSVDNDQLEFSDFESVSNNIADAIEMTSMSWRVGTSSENTSKTSNDAMRQGHDEIPFRPDGILAHLTGRRQKRVAVANNDLQDNNSNGYSVSKPAEIETVSLLFG